MTSSYYKLIVFGLPQVERIQNKVLYQNFDEQRRRIANRWATAEPNLQVMTRLWHGTTITDPSVIYDSEEGTLLPCSAVQNFTHCTCLRFDLVCASSVLA